MFNMKDTLSSIKTPIQVAVVGIGKMGKSLVDRLFEIPGMRPRVVINRTLENAKNALLDIGVERDNIVVIESTEDLDSLDDNQVGITDNPYLTFASKSLDVYVEATGSSAYGADIAYGAITNKKHVVMFNIECDAVVGPSLYKLAKENGVIYSGTGGDEPAAIIELMDFAYGLGLEIVAAGKGKNNPKDIHITNEQLVEEAKRQKLTTGTLTSFVDATNTMLELCAVSNATGFLPDKIGAHGIHSDIESLGDKLRLKTDGGMLNSHKVLDYVHGIAPGVFVAIKATTEQSKEILEYVGMGDGPIYTLFRPYHLCSLETPRTIYNAVVLNTPDIAPVKGQISDVVALAKRDIKKGESILGIGSDDTYGTITTHEYATKNYLVPIGLITPGTTSLVDIPKDSYITYEMVKLDQNATIVKLRKEQDSNE